MAQAFDRYDAWMILACAAFLYVNLFANPETPFLLGGDQVYFWTDAQRLLYGEHLYRDFFQFTAPGTDLVYLGIFKLFGPRIWTTNLVVLLLGISLCVTCLRISRSIMPRTQAVLATSVYLVLVIGMTLDGTHHWFSVLAAVGAAVVLMEERTYTRIAIAGAMLGLATFFTQTRGPAVALGIAIWMMWEHFRTREPWSSYLKRDALLLASLIGVWALLSSYYIATLGLRQLWFFQVTYVREYVVTGWNAWSVGIPQGLSRSTLIPWLRWLFAFIVLPSVYALCLWRCWKIAREGAFEKWTRLSLLTIVGTALFAEVAQSPNWFRLYCVSLPAVILLIWLVSGADRFRVYATRLLWIGVIGLAGYETWAMHAHYSTIESLPAGRIAVPPIAGEKLAWLAAHTQPGEFMLQAEWPGMYLPLRLRDPIFLDALESSRANQLGYIALSVRQLSAKHVRYIVYSSRLNSPEYAEFNAFLVSHYRLVRSFADHDEIWERNPDADAAG